MKDEEREFCFGHMEALTNCLMAIRVRRVDLDYTEVIANGLQMIPQYFPQGGDDIGCCLSGGKYIVTTGDSGDASTMLVHCSVHGACPSGP